MYAAVRWYPGGSELLDAIVQNESDVKRIISGIEGFRSYYMVRTAEGDAMSVSVFDDQNGAEESNRQAADWVRQNAADVAVTPQLSGGEVVINF